MRDDPPAGAPEKFLDFVWSKMVRFRETQRQATLAMLKEKFSLAPDSKDADILLDHIDFAYPFEKPEKTNLHLGRLEEISRRKISKPMKRRFKQHQDSLEPMSEMDFVMSHIAEYPDRIVALNHGAHVQRLATSLGVKIER